MSSTSSTCDLDSSPIWIRLGKNVKAISFSNHIIPSDNDLLIEKCYGSGYSSGESIKESWPATTRVEFGGGFVERSSTSCTTIDAIVEYFVEQKNPLPQYDHRGNLDGATEMTKEMMRNEGGYDETERPKEFLLFDHRFLRFNCLFVTNQKSAVPRLRIQAEGFLSELELSPNSCLCVDYVLAICLGIRNIDLVFERDHVCVEDMENNQEDDLQIYVAKIPKIYIPSVLMSQSESKEMNKPIRGADIEVKPITKASPTLRPRAVVSSPDNDAMIGNMNMIEERKAKKGLKSKDHIKSRASQLKNVNTNVKISHRIVAKLPGVNSRDHK
ncbi:putative protein [Arabidopsis thaliana]|uniref:Uncharacterized protein AT4g21860 n=1 Tax=Arabidopsis thaliana TaxID=3702 RepID=O49709_ARATH|nr:putative protein [Arabidopsis thaliana]CAB79141.1 putative protein [Arabidopsis thaliana]